MCSGDVYSAIDQCGPNCSRHCEFVGKSQSGVEAAPSGCGRSCGQTCGEDAVQCTFLCGVYACGQYGCTSGCGSFLNQKHYNSRFRLEIHENN